MVCDHRGCEKQASTILLKVQRSEVSAIALASEWKGSGAKPEQATINVYLIGSGGKIGAVITDLLNPNGQVFSPDEK